MFPHTFPATADNNFCQKFFSKDKRSNRSVIKKKSMYEIHKWWWIRVNNDKSVYETNKELDSQCTSIGDCSQNYLFALSFFHCCLSTVVSESLHIVQNITHVGR